MKRQIPAILVLILIVIVMIISLASCKNPKHPKLYVFEVVYQNGDIDTLKYVSSGMNYLHFEHGDLQIKYGAGVRTLVSGVKKWRTISITRTNDPIVIMTTGGFPE